VFPSRIAIVTVGMCWYTLSLRRDQLTIRTNRDTAVSALRYGSLAAWHTYVTATRSGKRCSSKTGFVRENQDELNGQCLLALSCHPLWSGCGVSFTARGNVGWLSLSASPSDNRGAATRNASTSFCSLDASRSFCLRTS
jgi:hypothetical protein